jgi:carbon storage regulator
MKIMLVLSRQVDESIYIGEVEVKVVRIQGGRVRLGVTAPATVPVHRQEVYDAIERSRAGESLPDIEIDLDYREQPHTTNIIPAASMAPEYRCLKKPSAESTLADAVHDIGVVAAVIEDA